jgi:tripartite ATP-independent transporter DctP family solute receptor
MQRRTFVVASALALAAVAAWPLTAAAQQKLKFAHVYEISEPYHTAALWAANEIAKRTNGRYTMEVFPASSLGKETDINQGLTLGTVDIIYTGQLFAGRNYGPISIGGAPYMFRDLDHWKKFAASTTFQDLGDGYQKASGGNKVVAITYYGERHTTANKAINTPDDMKNLKIRVPDAPLYTLFPRATGANPTPIAFAEVYLALQNKTVEAQENPLPTIEAKKFYEVQSHVNLTGHITDALLTIVGGPLWSKLSEADRKVFVEVFAEAAARATQEIVVNEQKLATDMATKYGRTVVKVDRAPFRAAVEKYYQAGKLPDGNALPWPKETYDAVQALK